MEKVICNNDKENENVPSDADSDNEEGENY